MDFLLILYVDLKIFCPFGGYWALFEAKSWGKLGDGYQLQIYINQVFLRPCEDIQIRVMLNIFQAKAIFMQGSC
jgi:hypothetical protein